MSWAEFAAGPQMLEALNAGAIDIAQTGEAPPIFAQAASDRLVYIAHEPPAPHGEAILVPKDSPIQSLADLKGKTIGLNKGSNVHFLLVKALRIRRHRLRRDRPPPSCRRPTPAPPSPAARSTPGRSGTRSRPPPSRPSAPAC